MLVLLIVALLWSLALLLEDAYQTAKGVKSGIAVEGNSLVTYFAKTDKPTEWQVFSVEAGLIRVPVFLVGLLALMYGVTYLPFLAAVVLVVAGVKNIQGARKWQWMFDHPGQKLPVMNTVWQKIVGFWG